MDYTTLKPLSHTWTTQDDLYGLGFHDHNLLLL